MESKAGGDSRRADRYARATALLRALTGVKDARIEADTGGIRAILVTAEPGASARDVTRNVQSALLASLGLAVERAVVRVEHAAPQPVPALVPMAAAGGPFRVANGNGHGHGESNGHGQATMPPPAAGVARPALTETAGATVRGAAIARLELEQRGAGRLACRVVLALAGRIAAGEAEGEDTAGGRLETAARAVIAASPAAGAELDGVRPVQLAGRNYVLVAVRSWSGRELVYRAGTAVQEASPEAAAARAALDALVS